MKSYRGRVRGQVFLKLWITVTTALAVAAVTVPGVSGAGGKACRSAAVGSSVVINCKVRGMDSFKVHLRSTVKANKLQWSLSCGADRPALTVVRTVGKRYDIRVDARSNPAAYETMTSSLCRLEVVGSLTRPGKIKLTVEYRQ